MKLKKTTVECEGRILEIDVAEVKRKLASLGANEVSNGLQKRYVFNVVPETKNMWVRLRTDGVKSSLTLKEIVDDSVVGTREWETEIETFGTVLEILERAGIKRKGYQENHRTAYSLNGVEICIDRWPKIPPYLEIEASSEEEVVRTAKLLGFSEKDVTGINNIKIYRHYGIDLDKTPELRFDDQKEMMDG